VTRFPKNRTLFHADDIRHAAALLTLTHPGRNALRALLDWFDKTDVPLTVDEQDAVVLILFAFWGDYSQTALNSLKAFTPKNDGQQLLPPINPCACQDMDSKGFPAVLAARNRSLAGRLFAAIGNPPLVGSVVARIWRAVDLYVTTPRSSYVGLHWRVSTKRQRAARAAVASKLRKL